MVSEDEARRLLAEETARTTARLDAVEKKGRRAIAIVIIVGVILCMAGVGIAWVMGNMRK